MTLPRVSTWVSRPNDPFEGTFTGTRKFPQETPMSLIRFLENLGVVEQDLQDEVQGRVTDVIDSALVSSETAVVEVSAGWTESGKLFYRAVSRK